MKVELHAHTSETSPCSHITASHLVQMYSNCGYDAIVITDHYSKWVMDYNKIENPDDFTNFFLGGYKSALKYSQNPGCGLNVLLGAEISLLESPNDYLLYGTDIDFFFKNPLLFKLSLKELFSLCRKNNILLVQAHPNRAYCTPAKPDLLDGAEVYNGNMRHNSNNDKTLLWAHQNNLIMTSGSDFHEEEDLARGGIITNNSFKTIHELTEILSNGSYEIIQKN